MNKKKDTNFYKMKSVTSVKNFHYKKFKNLSICIKSVHHRLELENIKNLPKELLKVCLHLNSQCIIFIHSLLLDKKMIWNLKIKILNKLFKKS